MLKEPFITNSTTLDANRQMLIITGPNMGGKSTYMRQCAIITLLAHTGSYVPATKATIGVTDRIFTRIGSSDDLVGGRSTFMVEMTETANILNNATQNSLILMDEIGRGTSTFDGLSLVWSTVHYLAQQIGALTLFATHYFELTHLPDKINTLVNVHLTATEHGDKIVFLHHVQEGPASQSYGLQVAQLAGVPHYVIDQARRKLLALEQGQLHTPVSKQHRRHKINPASQPDLFAVPAPHPVVTRLEAIIPDDLSPKEAQTLLYQLKDLL